MKKIISIIFVVSFIIFGFTKKSNMAVPGKKLMADTISSISGVFNSYYYTHIDAIDNLSYDSLNTAEFYPSAINSQTSTTVSAGNISLNTVDIPYNSDYLRYFQTATNINMNILNWTVSGSTNIPAFSFSFTPVYPSFDYGSLPDSCTKSSGITITLNSLVNNDPNLFVSSATLQQSNGAIKITKTINYAAITNNTVFFSSTDLASFNTNANLDIIISLQNYNYITAGHQSYAYIVSRHFKKDSFLK